MTFEMIMAIVLCVLLGILFVVLGVFFIQSEIHYNRRMQEIKEREDIIFRRRP